MSLQEFIKMDMMSRAEIVLDQGVFLEGYLEGGRGVQIYYFKSYFVEIVFSESETIIEVMPFVSGYRKEKYPVLGIQN